ncbi:MAG TPA: zf-HC2 domain-containing protein, partial [Thermoanaerobaculia bacterium]|nr:zf-HC2 domain-containing protein [Thermoanaerobaculia bacterium]
MREWEDHGERVHQRVWELLPWYVNGSLAERERERVETHLAACLRCQEEERVSRHMAGAMARGGETAPAPHPVQLQRMLARIEESEREERESAGRWRLLAPLRSLVRATPRPLRGALVAQAAVILLLIGFL